MSWPGAATSLKMRSRSENIGTEPSRVERADADHVRQRRRIARERPGLARRLVAVADRRDDDDALARTAYATAAASSGEYVSRAGLSGSRRPPRLRLITRAPSSTAQRIARASASSEIVPVAADDLRDSSSARNAMPGDALALSILRRDQPGDERPVPLPVDAPVAADEAAAVRDPALRTPGGPRRCRSRSPRPARTRAAAGSAGQASNARTCSRYHWRGSERVVRRERELPRAGRGARRQATPGIARATRGRASGLERQRAERARALARRVRPSRSRPRAPTASAEAPGSRPTAYRAACGGDAAASSAARQTASERAASRGSRRAPARRRRRSRARRVRAPGTSRARARAGVRTRPARRRSTARPPPSAEAVAADHDDAAGQRRLDACRAAPRRRRRGADAPTGRRATRTRRAAERRRRRGGTRSTIAA